MSLAPLSAATGPDSHKAAMFVSIGTGQPGSSFHRWSSFLHSIHGICVRRRVLSTGSSCCFQDFVIATGAVSTCSSSFNHSRETPWPAPFVFLLLARIATPSLRGCFRLAHGNDRRSRTHCLHHFLATTPLRETCCICTQFTKSPWLGSVATQDNPHHGLAEVCKKRFTLLFSPTVS